MAARAKTKPVVKDWTEQEYEIVPTGGNIDVLKEHPQNPNKGDVVAIDESIDENGWFGVIVAQRSTGYILAGNHRYRAAVARGAESVPVVWKDVDDETAIKILLADNRIAEKGVRDADKIDELLSGLTSLRGTGFGLQAVEEEERAADAAEDAKDGEDEVVPEDKYEPSYGVMLVVETEEEQEQLYEALSALRDGEPLHRRRAAHVTVSQLKSAKMRVVAV